MDLIAILQLAVIGSCKLGSGFCKSMIGPNLRLLVLLGGQGAFATTKEITDHAVDKVLLDAG